MQPDQNSQGAYFDRTSRNQLQAHNASEMYGRRVGAPDHPAGSDQASQALFGGNAQEMSPWPLDFAAGFGTGAYTGFWGTSR